MVAAQGYFFYSILFATFNSINNTFSGCRCFSLGYTGITSNFYSFHSNFTHNEVEEGIIKAHQAYSITVVDSLFAHNSGTVSAFFLSQVTSLVSINATEFSLSDGTLFWVNECYLQFSSNSISSISLSNPVLDFTNGLYLEVVNNSVSNLHVDGFL